MFHKWGHGHSLGAGVIGGLLLDQRTWALAIGCLLLGLMVGRFWFVAARAAKRTIERLEEAHQSKLATERLSRSVRRIDARHKLEAFWTSKRTVKEALEREYARGVSEGIASYRP